MGTSPNRSYPYPAGSDAVDVPGDMEALADAVDTDVEALESRTITAGTGLTGGGDLSANRTVAIANNGVGATQLATDAVETAKVKDAAITDAKLAGSIAPAKVTGTAVVQARQVATGTGLTGGGDLSADRTLSIAAGGVGTTQLADGAATLAKTSGVAPATALRLPGTSGNYVSTPDSAALDLTGDIEIIILCALTNWVPGGNGTQLVGKRSSAANGDFAYQFYITGAGQLGFAWYDTGTSAIRTLLVNPSGLTNGEFSWLRVQFDKDTGSGCSAVFSRSTDGATWTTINTATNATAATLQANSALVEIGAHSTGTVTLLAGRVQYAEIKDGIGGTTVASFDARAPMGPRYTDPQGNVWTINGSAWSWSRA